MNEKVIWNFIYSKCKNPYGTSAIMGNLMAESSLDPTCVTGSKDSDYIQKANTGTIDFVHDGCAFGLVQWCYHSRKKGLLSYAQSKGLSVGDINIQLEYMWKELSESYKTVYNAIISATNIRTASDIIMLKYEKPANTSEAMKKRRANYGQEFFDIFSSSDNDKNNQKQIMKKVVVTSNRVNLRSGNGTSFPKVSQVNKNAMYEWVATSENNWYAIKIPGKVVWVSGEFSKLIN